jgi:NADH:ubiquinone oxidoreductase subunit 2 (subunit N)
MLILLFDRIFIVLSPLTYDVASNILMPSAILVTLITSMLAFFANNPKKIIVYSTITNVGYTVMMICLGQEYRTLLISSMIVDNLTKMAIFSMLAYGEEAQKTDKKIINANYVNYFIYGLILCFSAAMPFTGNFLVKIMFLDTLLTEKYYINFISVVLTSFVSVLYHIKLVKKLLLTKHVDDFMLKKRYGINLMVIVILQFLSVVVVNNLNIVI